MEIFKTRYGDWRRDRLLAEGVGVVARVGREEGRGRCVVWSWPGENDNGTSLSTSQGSEFRRSGIKVGLEPVFGNERLTLCEGDGDAASVGSVSAVGSGDTEMGLVPGPGGCVGGKVGNDSPVAAGNGTDEAEAAELVDGVGDERPESSRRGGM